MKYRIRRILSLCLACILLGACAAEDSGVLDPRFETEEYLPQYDMQNEFSFINVACETEDTLYYMMFMGERQIHYYNKETGEGGILCGKPECTHDVDDCNSFAITAGGLNIYDGRIWFITWNTGAPGSILYAMNLDGTKRERIQALSYQGGHSTKMHLHRGYLYIGVTQREVIEGEPSYHLTITRQEIGNEADEPELVYESRARMTQLFRYIIQGNTLYGYRQYAESTDIEQKTELFRCDLTKGTQETLAVWDSTSTYPGGLWIDGENIYMSESEMLGEEEKRETWSTQLWVWQYSLREGTIEKRMEMNHPRAGGQWEIAPDLHLGAVEQVPNERQYAFTILDISGEIVREYIVENNPTGGELSGQMTYGMTEEGMICSISRMLEQKEKGDPVSLEEIWWVPVDPAEEVEKLAEYYTYTLVS